MSSSAHDVLISLLVYERTQRGLSQREFAAPLAKPPNFVARIETRQRNVSVLEFIILARALGIAPDKLFKQLLTNLPDDPKG